MALVTREGGVYNLLAWVYKGRTKTVDMSLLLRGGSGRDLPD